MLSAQRQHVDLGGKNEVVLVHAVNLMGLQRDRGIAPTEGDVRVMTLTFRDGADLIHKGQREK